jgi:ribosome-binding protein aMBF1 (putative translation factor)
MEYNNIIEQQLAEHNDPEIEKYIELYFDIVDIVQSILEKKGLTHNDLAAKMSKN